MHGPALRYKQVLTELYPIAAIYIEGLVTFVDLPVEGVEHEAIRAQLLRGYSFVTLIVFVTLLRVLELTVLLRTVEGPR
jgi:uncharacterized membrane protein YqjE